MALREDDVAPRSGAPDRRILLQVGGFALAVAATVAVFLTDNAQVLRLAVLGAAWAFVLATFAAAGRSTDRVVARAREAELRRAYQHELDQEVAARREYELELETELRRETEESLRDELDALRDELAGLNGLRAELARVADVRTDLTALSALRDEVARVAALRDDVSALGSLRHDLGQLGELRGEMARLRAELTEQLSSEMLVERIVMRTQAGRLTSELQESPGRAIDAATRWADDTPPRELTGGWPAVRLDEPHETRQFDQVRAEPARPPAAPSPSFEPSRWTAREPGPAPRPGEAPATTAWDVQDLGHRPAAPPAGDPVRGDARWSPSRNEDRWSPPREEPWTPAVRDDDAPLWSATAQADAAARQAPPTTAFPMTPPTRRSRPSPTPRTTAGPALPPPVAAARAPEPLPPPPEAPAARSQVDAEPTSFRPAVPPRRRRGDEAPGDPAAAATTQRPAVAPHPPIRIDDRGGYRAAVREEPAEPSPPASAEKRLADILAENNVSPPAGGRRRRRYRDEDEPDDVLARVLGQD